MEKIKVKRDELLAVLKTNRETHRDIFLKALEGYKVKVIEVLEERLKQARSGKRVSTFVNLTQPVDQTKDYDRAIKMIEMSVEQDIVLAERDFLQYVMDDWGWKQQFTSSNKLYASASFPVDETEEDEA